MPSQRHALLPKIYLQWELRTSSNQPDRLRTETEAINPSMSSRAIVEDPRRGIHEERSHSPLIVESRDRPEEEVEVSPEEEAPISAATIEQPYGSTVKPSRQSVDDVYGTPRHSPLLKTDTTRDPSARESDYRDPSEKKYVLSRQGRQQATYNYGHTTVRDSASVTLGTIAKDTRYEPPEI